MAGVSVGKDVNAVERALIDAEVRGASREDVKCIAMDIGYFGVTMPVFSVKWCHFKRSNNSTKINYSFFKIPFLNDSPLRSIRCDEFTNRSKMASAIVPSPMMSYQTDTGICDETMVDI